MFRVCRSERAPIVLNVEGMERKDIKFSVDLVPSFKFEISELRIACSELHERIMEMKTKNNISDVQVFLQFSRHPLTHILQSFMAIALNKASPDMFEIDFHDLERGLLKSVGGCVKKVIMLMKYFRDNKGGTFSRLWSHLLKVKIRSKNRDLLIIEDHGDEPLSTRET